LIGQSEQHLKDSIQALRDATSALKLIQEPKPVPKDPVQQALPWLLLVSITLNLAVLATVLLQA
jgi:hypothetical protein